MRNLIRSINWFKYDVQLDTDDRTEIAEIEGGIKDRAMFNIKVHNYTSSSWHYCMDSIRYK